MQSVQSTRYTVMSMLIVVTSAIDICLSKMPQTLLTSYQQHSSRYAKLCVAMTFQTPLRMCDATDTYA